MVPGDVRLFVYALLGLVGLLLVIFLVAKALRYDLRLLLTPKERWILAKLLLAGAMLFAVVQQAIYLGLPADNLIYGRF